LNAGGGTEMADAITTALASLRPEAQRQIVLITDGYIGFESQAVGQILKHLPPGARVHTVGVGGAPNRTLTRGAARAGRGAEILVSPRSEEEVLDPAVQRLRQATESPVLTNVSVTGTAVAGGNKYLNK
jgi:Ca-activated chloride channel family protein